MSMKKSVIFVLFIYLVLSSISLAQTTHYAENDDREHEISYAGTSGQQCEFPVFGQSGSWTNASFGDSGGFYEFSIFSFDTETWSPGDSYILKFTELERRGTPFEDLGKIVIEMITDSEAIPDRYEDVMNPAGTYSEAEFFALGGLDISDAVNSVLSTVHERYLYIRFRFENCNDLEDDVDSIKLVSGREENPDSTVRIVQGSTVRSMYFAQFADGDGYVSEIVLVNLDENQESNVTVRIRKSDGTLMNVDLNGEEVNGEKALTIPAGGTVVLTTDGSGELQVGPVTVVSDTNLSGVILFSAPIGYAGVASSQALKSIVIPVRTDLPGTNVGLAVMSFGAAQTLQASLVSDAGTVLANAEIDLVAGGQDARFVNQFDWDTAVDLNNFTGSLVVVGSEDFGAIAILLRPGQFATLPVSEKPFLSN